MRENESPSNKQILNLKKILSCKDEYTSKRKGMIVITITGIVFWDIVLLACRVTEALLFLIPSIVAILFLITWIVKNSKDINDLHRGEFYIVISSVTLKKIEEHDDTDSFCSHYYHIYFPEYDGYEVEKYEYEKIEYGDEYFLVILKKKNKKIKLIFDANIFELSDEFYLSDDKYLINRYNK